jgi:hypothetical protein
VCKPFCAATPRYFVTYILIVGIVLTNVVVAVLLEKMTMDDDVEEVPEEDQLKVGLVYNLNPVDTFRFSCLLKFSFGLLPSAFSYISFFHFSPSG